MFSMYYKKNNNEYFFKGLECWNGEVKYSNLQNYNAIYELFFQLNHKNWNSINMDQHFSIDSIVEVQDDSHVSLKVASGERENTQEKESFIKIAPLFDPTKVLNGSIDINTLKSYVLPNKQHFDNLKKSTTLYENVLSTFDISECQTSCYTHIIEKINNPYNECYVDSFFSFLTSKMLHENGFIHGLDYYGSYCGNKKDFIYNIGEDIEYLLNSSYFLKHNNSGQYCLEEGLEDSFLSMDSRKNKKRLEFMSLKNELECDNICEDYELINDLFIENSDEERKPDTFDVSLNPEFEFDGFMTKKTQSTCSSRSSNTSIYDSDSDSDYDNNSGEINVADNIDIEDISYCVADEITDTELEEVNVEDLDSKSDSSENNSDNESNNDSECENDSDNDSDDLSSICSDDSVIDCTLYNFPVHLTFLEKLEDTLDTYMLNNKLSHDEWASILIQVCFSLLTYQKVFDFTHNDLHTNNIMYYTTTEEFIHYKWKNIIYKVPTFGKIYKIIDFGRSIYRFKDQTIFNDSYSKKGDASSMYNFGIYCDKEKPRLEPNKGFDLCRLGCSLFDYFIEDIEDCEEITRENPIAKLIFEWCSDDNGNNILYKSNGKERYPGFKLYKMIARHVNSHTPQNELQKDIFQKFAIESQGENDSLRETKIINIDSMKPCFVKTLNQ